MKQALAVFLIVALQSSAQQQLPFSVQPADGPKVVRSYQAAALSPIRLENSTRLNRLMEAGKLYLTVQDAIALAIENNLDLELSRYGPLSAEWQLHRAEAGGPLRGVPSGNAQIGQVASGQGVSGSQASAGVGGGGGGGGGGSTGGASVSQIGPVTANLDPVVQNATVFSHITSPQVNTRQSRTTALVSQSNIYNTSIQQGLLTGGFAQVSYRDSHLKENTPTNILNPSVAPRLYFYFQQNLLQGFGRKVNSRFIRVAERNASGSIETFRSQVIDLVANVLNVYWGLVVDHESLKGKQRALEISNKFFKDTQREIEIGVLSRVDIYRTEAEMGTRRRELLDAQTAVRQRENLLKNLISRTGMADPVLDRIEIIPVDTIRIPQDETLPTLRQLVAVAQKKRPDVMVSSIRLENARTSALGTESGVLPQLVGLAQFYNSGLAGEAQSFGGVEPDPSFVGGTGTALSQVFRGKYANQRGAVYGQMSFNNRIHQGDYGVDQLQIRQTELRNLRDMNQMVVDISNQLVALRQARARYSTAVNTRVLQKELLEKQQRMFSLGTGTINEVITAQRNLVNAETSEVTALGSYVRAQIGIDQIVGETLEKNNVSLDDSLRGNVPAR